MSKAAVHPGSSPSNEGGLPSNLLRRQAVPRWASVRGCAEFSPLWWTCLFLHYKGWNWSSHVCPARALGGLKLQWEHEPQSVLQPLAKRLSCPYTGGNAWACISCYVHFSIMQLLSRLRDVTEMLEPLIPKRYEATFLSATYVKHVSIVTIMSRDRGKYFWWRHASSGARRL